MRPIHPTTFGVSMTDTYKATCVRLSPETRRLFKEMNFYEIPEEANYIAFLDNGEACFFEVLDTVEGFMPAIPRIAIINYYEDITVTF
jgi:hypothetical protein